MEDNLLIHVPHITSRLQYIMKIMISDLLQTEFVLTTDPEYYVRYKGPKFAYGSSLNEGICFESVGLLFETGTREQALSTITWNGLNLIFPVAKGCLPFDPFALCFYLVSRYEEYLPTAKKDLHDRFDITRSLAYLNGFYRKPLVNILAYEIGSIIRESFPDFSFKKVAFKTIQTYDIDIAYQYKGKSAYRFLGSFCKSILKGDVKKIKKLLYALLNNDVEDEYDTFSYHQAIAGETENKPIHFILTASFGKYDRNIDPDSKAFQQLIERLKTFSDIAIHPSYRSSEKLLLISKEKKKLERIAGITITRSRQHFLRFQIPSTFNALIDNGITDDYSMGWTTEVGFRASISIPFLFYDVNREVETSLTIHPLAVMDTAIAQVCATTEEQKALFLQIKEEVKQAGGEFIVLQHNPYSGKSSIFSS